MVLLVVCSLRKIYIKIIPNENPQNGEHLSEEIQMWSEVHLMRMHKNHKGDTVDGSEFRRTSWGLVVLSTIIYKVLAPAQVVARRISEPSTVCSLLGVRYSLVVLLALP